ncbi:MAG: helix-turn-helix domain-containing protein [Thermomicrobiales bacterium]|nr:helix-turn-helix domain-containing protein [Thermomicrobiales bacterium]
MLSQVLQVDERSYDREPRSHHHPYCQVLLPAQGRIALDCPGERGWVGSGRVAVIPPEVEHRYHALSPNRIVVADFPVDQLDPRLALRPADTFRAQDARLITLTAMLQAEARSGGLGDPLVADALLRYLVAALAATRATDDARGTAATHRQIAAAAERYLQEHFRETLTAAEVAAAVGVSPSHLHRVFRAETGGTLVNRVHRLRLEAAAQRLRETNLTVLAIAHDVGFASQSHLTRLFTRQFGCAPGRYREACWHV